MSYKAMSEKDFEDNIVASLNSNNNMSEATTASFNMLTGFLDVQVINWINGQYPSVYKQYAKDHGSNANDRLIKDVRSAIDKNDGGTLAALRSGIELKGNPIKLMGLPDILGKNDQLAKAYKGNSFTFVRQLVLDEYNKSIDIVFFLNGICVFTWELKSTEKQSVLAAMEQYKSANRDPNLSPVLRPITGALAHFAISNQYVYVTTALKREETVFIPFNLGTPNGGGNPVNPIGDATSYLWESVFTRENLLDIIADYIFIENSTLVFPRYHQWDCVEVMKKSAREIKKLKNKENHFLIQHSPGSGKTKTITWLAHHLARIFVDGEKLFDSIILVTDRKMLDNQLEEALKSFDKAERFSHASKSKKLAELIRNKENIITTLHKFHHGFKGIKRSIKNGRVAVIIDEAHSSQSGDMASTMLEKISENIGENIALYAFTATPTKETLNKFGSPDHVYSMRQAIAEGFIVNVLRNIEFNTFVFNASVDPLFAQEEVDSKIFKGDLFKKALCSEEMIGIKSRYILRHFIDSVYAHSPWGKAMIVANSIQSAIAYKVVMDMLITEEQLSFKTLISYTGKAKNPEMGVRDESLSSQLCGAGFMKNDDKWIRENFGKDESKFLIVVDKYTTGFDQPKLMAMYVDKKMEDVRLVQTINRLNRSHPGKSDKNISILDLSGNTPDVYKKSVAPYYGETDITGSNNLCDKVLSAKHEIEKFGITIDASNRLITEVFPGSYLGQIKNEMIATHGTAVSDLIRAINIYTSNYYFAINAGYPNEHDFYQFIKSLSKLLLEHYEMNAGSIKNEAVNTIKIDKVVHASSVLRNLSETEDSKLISDEGSADGASPGSERKTVAECMLEVNTQMLAMLDQNGILHEDGTWGIKDVLDALANAEKQELSVNSIRDLADGSDPLLSIKRFARGKGVIDCDRFSIEILPFLKQAYAYQISNQEIPVN